MNRHAMAEPPKPRRPAPANTLIRLTPLRLLVAFIVIDEALKRSPLLEFILFEVAAVVVATMIACEMLQVIK